MRPFAKIKDATDERLVDNFHLQATLGKASERRRLARVISSTMEFHGVSEDNVEFCLGPFTGYNFSS